MRVLLLEAVFLLQLPKVRLELSFHGIGIDPGDVADVLRCHELSKIIGSLLPCQPIGKEQKSGIGSLRSDDLLDVPNHISHLGASRSVTFGFDHDTRIHPRWDCKIALCRWNARLFLYQLRSDKTGTRGAVYGAREEAYGGADRESAAAG